MCFTAVVIQINGHRDNHRHLLHRGVDQVAMIAISIPSFQTKYKQKTYQIP